MNTKFSIFSIFYFYLSVFVLFAQVPQYYTNIDFTLQGDQLKDELSELIIDTHTNLIPYTSSSTDTWDVLRISDLVDVDSNNVLLIYGYDDTDESTKNDRTRNIYSNQSGSCIGYWNREHVYAKSLANPSLVTNQPGPGTDIHNLRSADCQMNSTRNNRLFVNGSGNSGTLGSYFFPGDEFKGDVARIIMYMYLRYPSQCEPLNIGVGSSSYSQNADIPDLFLDWNDQDPVSEFELNRNDVIYSYQGNRNPFIDNPYLATLIWNGPITTDSWGVLSTGDLTNDNLTVFPTITSDYLYINGIINEQYSVQIFNQLGQALEVEVSNNRLDVSEFSSGVYILKLSQKSRVQQTKFFVR